MPLKRLQAKSRGPSRRELAASTVWVRVPAASYPVRMERGLTRRWRDCLPPEVLSGHCHVVVDAAVERLHRSKVRALLQASRGPSSLSLVPSGERSKSPSALTRLWRESIRAGSGRDSVVVAIGGGVVGDLAGFAAGTLLRGVRVVQVPTTLLAMVDASVGGKTGINLPEGKNLVGVIHQPISVIVDPEFLDTLPPREYRAGWAEVIKAGAIGDRRLLQQLEADPRAHLDRQPAAVAWAIHRAVRLKARVVRSDERETGARRLLNFGHTLGHALEATLGYRRLLHGEAVSIGMVFAARLGEVLGRTPRGFSRRLEAILRAFGLPTSAPRVSRAALLAAMGRDKKRGPSGIRWVLVERPGHANWVDSVPGSAVERCLSSFLKGESLGY